MTVTSISRCWCVNPSMVSMVTTDPLEIAMQTGWLASQQDSIGLVNNGEFEWNVNDVILVNFQQSPGVPSGSHLFDISPDLQSIIPHSPLYTNTQAITAHAGGGQANAVQLNIGVNVVETVASVGDSVKLPDDVLNQTTVVYNRGANALHVFPYLGDSIDAIAVNDFITMPSGYKAIFIGMKTHLWGSFLTP